VADGEDVRDLIPDVENIRLIHLEDQLSIGTKRNFGCERALGKIIAHWDDDDYSAPDRLADQLGRLHSSGKMVTGYHSMRFKEDDIWWQYPGTIAFAIGTSLCYYREFWRQNQFPHIQIGEDNAFQAKAWELGQIENADAREMMYATIHAGNTSPRNLKTYRRIE